MDAWNSQQVTTLVKPRKLNESDGSNQSHQSRFIRCDRIRFRIQTPGDREAGGHLKHGNICQEPRH